MAATKEAVQEKPKATVKKAAAPANKPVYRYSVDELARASEVRFGVKPEVVKAAFRLIGIERATMDDAAEIIKNFLERKVN